MSVRLTPLLITRSAIRPSLLMTRINVKMRSERKKSDANSFSIYA